MRGGEIFHAPFTLRLGISLLRPSHMRALLIVVFGVPLIILALLVHVTSPASGDDPGYSELLETFWSEFLRDPGNRLMLWALVVLLPLGVLAVFVQRLAHIRVTSTGLQARIPPVLGLGLFGQSGGQWDVRWEDVRRVRMVAPKRTRNTVQRLGWFRLVIETGRGEVRLNPFPWFNPDAEDHRLRLGELLRFGRLDAGRRVKEAPLIEVIEARGFEIEQVSGEGGDRGTASAGFDLARHRGMVVQLGLFLAAATYAIADTFFISAYRPLESLPAMPFVMVGLAALAGIAVLGRGVPRLERLAVGALTVISLVAAVHPATLRFNASTAESRIVAYEAVGPGRFRPVDGEEPSIDLRDLDVDRYWARYPRGAEHRFTLLRGIPGFEQLDLAPLYERTRAFYRAQER